MAHQIDNSNGRNNMSYVGETPWHGLGSKLQPGAYIDEWKTQAGLDWGVLPEELTYKDLVGDRHAYPGRKALVRSDTGKALSIVSDRYQAVQPPQVLEFFRDLTGQLGSFEMETAGALDGGRKIWALAKAKDEIRLGAEDVVGRYLLLATSYDRSIETIVQQTSVRVVCQNTLSASVSAGNATDGETRLTIRHNQVFDGNKVKQRMMLDTRWAAFGERVNLLAGCKVNSDTAVEYFTSVLFTDAERNSAAFSKKKAKKHVERLMAIAADAPGQQLASADGTVWGLVNAVTYFVDHKARVRVPKASARNARSARLDKAWFGSGARLKSRAVGLANQLVRV